MNSPNNLISRARDFALQAHADSIITTVSGLKRPGATHLQEVADLVWASGGSDEEIAAAWLHDSVEDTTTTLDTIREKFGNTVAEIVRGLTDLEEFNGLPIPERKKKQSERILSESESVRRVKIADQTSNVRSLGLDPDVTMTPAECKEYIEGAKLITDNCQGISPLLDEMFLKAYREGKERYASTN